MKALSPDDIQFHPTSFCDGHGRVFWSDGELFRGIPENRAAFTRDLFDRGVVADLVAKKFIPRTELADVSLPGYPVVLHHERIPFVSYAFEWSPSMLREAALFLLRYLGGLARHDLTLAGVASWNILFAGSEPRAVDFGDLITAPHDQEALWSVLEAQFRSYYLRPLQLFAHGQSDLARLLQTDYEHDAIQRQFDLATATPVKNLWQRGARSIQRRTRILAASRSRGIGEPGSYFHKKLREYKTRISKLRFPQKRDGRSLAPAARDYLKGISPAQSALVVGGNDETVALLAATGAMVVAIDRDEQRVDAIYEHARSEAANVLPLVLDLRYPAPGYGVQNAVLAPALSRLRCDLVVALGLIESLVFRQRLRFDQIAGTFAALARRRLLVDFPSQENPVVVQHLRDPYFSWFGLEQFTQALEQHFYSVHAERGPAGAATLLACEKGAA